MSYVFKGFSIKPREPTGMNSDVAIKLTRFLEGFPTGWTLVWFGLGLLGAGSRDVCSQVFLQVGGALKRLVTHLATQTEVQYTHSFNISVSYTPGNSNSILIHAHSFNISVCGTPGNSNSILIHAHSFNISVCYTPGNSNSILIHAQF